MLYYEHTGDELFRRYYMNIKIGAIVKKLRTENNTTQDTLATAMGVTPQAISRWESGGGYPDLELLPLLADFFRVSTDELLGYKMSEREQELASMKKEMDRIAEVGSVEEQVAYARSAYVRYPNDYEIRCYLGVSLYLLWEEKQEEALFQEIETLLASVANGCVDESTRYDAISALILLYGKVDQYDKAIAWANRLTPMKYCRETALSGGVGDGKTKFYIQDEIDKLTDGLGLAIQNLVLNEYLPNDPSTWESKIEMLRVANRLYFMIYGDDLMFHHNRVSFNHWVISTYQMSLGRPEEAMDTLKKCVIMPQLTIYPTETIAASIISSEFHNHPPWLFESSISQRKGNCNTPLWMKKCPAQGGARSDHLAYCVNLSATATKRGS